MEFIPLIEGVEIKVGDAVLVKRGDDEIVFGKVAAHTKDNEIVYNKKKNQYFHIGLYLLGHSSHKEVYIIK